MSRCDRPFLAALALGALILVGWGAGENGDLPFALGVVLLAGACFFGGRTMRRWWAVPLAIAVWALGGFFGGRALDRDSYAWSIGLFAPLAGAFFALGTGSGRRKSRLTQS